MGYFKVYTLGEKTWYIREKLGVGSYLFEGNDSALLLDTGNGFRDIKKQIDRLTNKPLTVLISHGHADHVGGNGQFPSVYIHPADVHMLSAEYQDAQRERLLGYIRRHYPFLRPLIRWLLRLDFQQYQTEVKLCEHGQVFDLGGRVLRAIHCPGHSPGSIAVTDSATKTLFTGDAVNPGLFLFFEGSPTFSEYADELSKLAELIGVEQIMMSHEKAPLPFNFIRWYAEFLRRADLDKSKMTNIPNGDDPVYKYSESGKDFGIHTIAVHFTKKQTGVM